MLASCKLIPSETRLDMNTPLLQSRRQTPLWRLSACTGEVYCFVVECLCCQEDGDYKTCASWERQGAHHPS